jgi:hypothetical protein
MDRKENKMSKHSSIVALVFVVAVNILSSRCPATA